MKRWYWIRRETKSNSWREGGARGVRVALVATSPLLTELRFVALNAALEH
ncbi:hypothetical protein KEM60_01263 [Austwickia sp. TVS 96-490-7B]|nr:hypothetical protein [Austwickia sp. TVS 96-490-7B]